MMPLATCPICQRLMDGSSCTDRRSYPWHEGTACQDCGVRAGYHHHACDQAHCIACANGNQLLICPHGDWPGDQPNPWTDLLKPIDDHPIQ